MQACACSLVELLGQACKTCLEADTEAVVEVEASTSVVAAMRAYSDNSVVQAQGVRALLSLSGCLTCRCYYDK